MTVLRQPHFIPAVLVVSMYVMTSLRVTVIISNIATSNVEEESQVIRKECMETKR